jgi:hypothetical protein
MADFSSSEHTQAVEMEEMLTVQQAAQQIGLTPHATQARAARLQLGAKDARRNSSLLLTRSEVEELGRSHRGRKGQ